MPLDVIELTVRQLLSRGRLLGLAGVIILPAFLSFLFAASDSTLSSEEFLTGLCDGLVLTTVLPLVALIFGGATFGNEVEDGTLLYLLMKPAQRAGIVAAKVLPAIVIVASLAVTSVLLAAFVAGQDADTLRAGLGFAAAVTTGGAAYTALFVFVGLVTSRTLVIGLVYVFLWEGVLTALFEGLRLLSVREYARGVAAAIADVPEDTLSVDMSLTGGLIGVAAVVVVSCVLATWRLSRMDVE